MVTPQEEHYMKVAIEQAKIAKKNNEWVGGSIIVKDGNIVARAANSVIGSADSTAHCEINAIRQASQKLGDWNLEGCELYTTAEPCPMCASASVWSGISKIYYGVSLDDLINTGDYQIKISTKEVVSKSFRQIEIVGGVLSNECLELFSSTSR